VSKQHDWPLDRPAKRSLHPWFFSATRYVVVLFRDGAEAQRALHGLMQQGIPEHDVRLYPSAESLAILSRGHERSSLTKALVALTIDPKARHEYVDNAKAGGAALLLYSPTEEHADRLVRLLADYDYASFRYRGDHVEQTLLASTR
jgi:hypothetical protein